jgi:hypothetical protein
MFNGLTEKEVYNLPKYVFSCEYGDGCTKKVEKMNNYIEEKYCDKTLRLHEDVVYGYVKNTQKMCLKQGTVGMSTTYLYQQLQETENNFFVIMDEKRNVPHTVVTYVYLPNKNMIYIQALCVNQTEGASRGYISMNILKEACKYAGIKNILLDSVEGAVDFYRRQGFSSFNDSKRAYNSLKRMTLKKSLTPRNSFSSQSFHSNTMVKSSTPQQIKTSINRESNNSNSSSMSLSEKYNYMNNMNNLTKRYRSLVNSEINSSSPTKMRLSELDTNDEGNNELNKKEYIRLIDEKMKNAIANVHNNRYNINTNNKNRTLIDLTNDKEYIVLDNELYVSDDNNNMKRNTTRSRSPMTKKRKISKASRNISKAPRMTKSMSKAKAMKRTSSKTRSSRLG